MRCSRRLLFLFVLVVFARVRCFCSFSCSRCSLFLFLLFVCLLTCLFVRLILSFGCLFSCVCAFLLVLRRFFEYVFFLYVLYFLFFFLRLVYFFPVYVSCFRSFRCQKERYAALALESRTYGRWRRQARAIAQGLKRLVPLSLLKMFNENELGLLLAGPGEIDPEDWERSVRPRCLPPAPPQVMSAWLAKTRHALPRHCRDWTVYGHTTTTMLDIEYQYISPIEYASPTPPQLVRRCHPCVRKSAPQAVVSSMQLILHAARRTTYGTSRLVQVMSVLSVETRRAQSGHCRDAKVYGHTTTAMHDTGSPPPPAQVGRENSRETRHSSTIAGGGGRQSTLCGSYTVR